MKKIFYMVFLICLWVFAVSGVLAFEVPTKPTAFVSDYASLLSREEAQGLESKLQAFEKSSGYEIAVVTISSLEGEEIADVAQQFFEKWGIGKKESNNGTLLLVALNDRQTRIHTGYGVEGVLTDLTTSYIQRDLLTPAFREGRYGAGVEEAVDTMMGLLSKEIDPNTLPRHYSNSFVQGLLNNFQVVLLFLFIGFQILIGLLAKTKSWWLGGVIGGSGAVFLILFFAIPVLASIITFFGLVGFGLLFDFLVSRAYGKGGGFGRGGFGGFGGGGFGGGSGSSGFGGFGGGFSGGGGSSGRW